MNKEKMLDGLKQEMLLTANPNYKNILIEFIIEMEKGTFAEKIRD